MAYDAQMGGNHLGTMREADLEDGHHWAWQKAELSPPALVGQHLQEETPLGWKYNFSSCQPAPKPPSWYWVMLKLLPNPINMATIIKTVNVNNDNVT